MSNVNIPLAMFTIFIRRFIDRFRSPNSNAILKHTPWYRSLRFLRPCVYMYLLGAGIYYAYRHFRRRQAAAAAPLSRQHSRVHRPNESSTRKRFSEKSKSWFFRKFTSGSKKRESTLRMQPSEVSGSQANLDGIESRRNSSESNYRNCLPSEASQDGSVSRRNSDISMTVSTDVEQEIGSKNAKDVKGNVSEMVEVDAQEYSGIDLTKFSATMKINDSISKDILERRMKMFEENTLGQGDQSLYSIQNDAAPSEDLKKRNRRNRLQKIRKNKVKVDRDQHTEADDDEPFAKKTRSGRVYGCSELELHIDV